MKKLYISICVFAFIFGVGCINTNARTLNSYFDIDETDYFNVFWEFNNQTEMSKFLVSHNNDLLDFLMNYGKDLTGQNSKGTSAGRTPNAVLIRKNLNNEYRVYVLQLSSIQLTTSNPELNISAWSLGYIFTFDNFMNLQNCEFINLNGNSESMLKLQESIQPLGFWGESDLTELFSTVFYTLDQSIYIRSDFDKINISYLKQSEKFYRFDNYAIKNVLSVEFWKNFVSFSSPSLDFESNFDLKYYKQNPVATDKTNSYFKSLGSVLFSESNITVPAGYESFTINGKNTIFYLTYRGNLDSDSTLYYSANFSDVDFYVSNFKLEDSLIKGKDMKFNVNSPNHLYSLDLNNIFELESMNDNTFMFYTDDEKYYKTIYYDPDCYHFNLRSLGSSDDLVLTNNSGVHTYTSSQVQKSYNQAINSDKGTIDSDKNESSDSTNGFDFSAATVLSGFKNFISSVGALCTSLGVFLADLPPALSGLIYSGVTMGIIAIIIKILL